MIPTSGVCTYIRVCVGKCTKLKSRRPFFPLCSFFLYSEHKEPAYEHRHPLIYFFFLSNFLILILKVEHAVREIKRLLIEASTSAIQAELRNPSGTVGRYSVV